MQTNRMPSRPPSRRRILAALGGALIVFALLAAVWLARQEAPSVLRVGVGQPLSGPFAEYGRDMLQGARIAAEQINKTGGVLIQGRRIPVEVVVADDAGLEAEGVAAARMLVGLQVSAVVAHLNSGVSIAAAPIYARASVAQFAISTKPLYTELGHATALRLVANDNKQAKAMAYVATTMAGGKRLALVDDGTPYGTGLMGIVEAAAKDSIVHKESLNPSVTEFRDLVRALVEAKADVLISALSDTQISALMPQLAGAGLGGLAIVGGDMLKSERFTRGAHRGEIFATTPIIGVAEFKTGATFLAAFAQRFGAPPLYAAHYASDAVYAVAEAAKHANSASPGKILKAIKTYGAAPPVLGFLTFDARGEQPHGAVGIYRASGAAKPGSSAQGGWELAWRSADW